MTAPALRGRLGLIVPSSNTVAEIDFHRGTPPDVTVHTVRMHLVEATVADERLMLERHLPQALVDLASAVPDVVAFGCTSAGAILGPAGEAQLIERIASTCNARSVSTNDAVGRAIEQLRPERIAILTPYVDELNQAIQAGLERRGLSVSLMRGMGLSHNQEIGRVPPEQIIEFAIEELDGASFDLLFVSCTNFRAVEAIPRLRELFSVPVVTSNGALLQASLAALAGEPTTAAAS